MKPKFSALSLLLLLACALSAAAAMPKFDMPRVQEPKIPKRTATIADFGAVPDGKTLNTEAIAKGIAALADKGGGRLVFPPGIWLAGPIRLRSNIELHLERGALLKFSGDFKLYPLMVIDMKGEKEVDSTSPIFGENLENVAITGEGIIDGGGYSWRPVKKEKMGDTDWKALIKSGGLLNDKGNMWWPSREAMDGKKVVDPLQKSGSLKLEDYEPARQYLRPKMVRLINCKKVLLQNITLQNPPGWTLNPALCEDVSLLGVTVHNLPSAQNSDALDLESCRRAIISDCTFDAGDDGICLKSGKDAAGRRIGVPTEDVLVEGCTVYHAHGGFVIGSEMSGGVRNVRVNNCTFMGTEVGLRFKSTRGRGGVVEKIYISHVRMTDILTEAIGFNMFYGGQGPGELGDGVATETKPVLASEKTPQFRDIYIEDVICRGARQAVALQGLPEMPIRGIHLSNVSLTAENGMTCTDAQDITLNHVEILNASGPVLSLLNSRDLSVDHLTYAAGDGAVIKADGTNNTAVIKRTDLKAGRPDFDLSNGAAADNFKVE
jgi:polygalacturonase